MFHQCSSNDLINQSVQFHPINMQGCVLSIITFIRWYSIYQILLFDSEKQILYLHSFVQTKWLEREIVGNPKHSHQLL